MSRIFYFDNPATTQIDPEILNQMLPIMQNIYGNPHSTSHKMGWDAFSIVNDARIQIAKLINAKDDEIIFTSGATESNNLAIHGIAKFYKSRSKHIITMNTEHKCVLNTCKHLEKEGYTITYLSPEPNGLLNIESLKKSITSDTILISIMAVNNETGVIQDLESIGKLAKENNIFFHTDAAQAFGKIPLDVEKLNIDLMSISGHKIYGPKGIGALYIRKKPRVRLSPIIYGGGQERGMRGGTVPTFLAFGLGLAAELCNKRMIEDNKRIKTLSDKFLNEILKIEDVYLNGSIKNKIPSIINLSILHIEGESLMMSMDDICLSTGSACNSSTLEPSYVITAMRNDIYYAHSALRFGLSRYTTEEEVDYLIKKLKLGIDKMRNMSPLWHMKKKGINFNEIKWNNHH